MSAIRTSAAACVSAFRSLAARIETNQTASAPLIDQISLEDEYGRFRVWAGNLGAQQRGHSSLDYRLRDSPLLRSNVLKLLSELDINLKEALAVVSGARLPYEQQLSSEDLSDDDDVSVDSSDLEDDGRDEEERPGTEAEQRMFDVVDIIDNLYKLSIRIRSPTLQSRSLKAAAYRPKDAETGVDVLSQYFIHDKRHVEELTAATRTTSSSPNESGPDWLVERLSRAITKRRQQFQYWRKHRDKLANGQESTGPTVGPSERRAASLLQIPDSQDANLAVSFNVVPVPASEKVSRTILSGTEVTAHDRSLDDAVDSKSVTSVATTAKDLTGNVVDLPPPPKGADGERDFECPYCFVICPARYGRERSWKTHILQDLQPYVCTYEHCSESEQVFRSRREWLEHESSSHRRLWRCPGHHEAVYSSKAALKNHLDQQHAQDLTEQQKENFISIAETSAIDSRSHCPICHVDTATLNNFPSHLANHLERIASFALPRDAEGSGDKSFASDHASGGRLEGSEISKNSSQAWSIEGTMQASIPVRATVSDFSSGDDDIWFTVLCQMDDGSHWKLQRLYGDFYKLHHHLLDNFPAEAGRLDGIERTIPDLPRIAFRIDNDVSMWRRIALNGYLRSVLCLSDRVLHSEPVRKFFQPVTPDTTIRFLEDEEPYEDIPSESRPRLKPEDIIPDDLSAQWPMEWIKAWLSENGFSEDWATAFETLGTVGLTFPVFGEDLDAKAIEKFLIPTIIESRELQGIATAESGLMEERRMLHDLITSIVNNGGSSNRNVQSKTQLRLSPNLTDDNVVPDVEGDLSLDSMIARAGTEKPADVTLWTCCHCGYNVHNDSRCSCGHGGPCYYCIYRWQPFNLAKKVEDVALTLHFHVDRISSHMERTNAAVKDLFALSSELRNIHASLDNALSRRKPDSPDMGRTITKDLDLLSKSLQHTVYSIRDAFNGERAATETNVEWSWKQLSDKFKTEGEPLVSRLARYLRFTKQLLLVLIEDQAPRDTSRAEDRIWLKNLLREQGFTGLENTPEIKGGNNTAGGEEDTRDAFIHQLSEYLDDPLRDGLLLSWTRTGDSFIVLDEDVFGAVVLPQKFSLPNLETFERVLTLYGFEVHKTHGDGLVSRTEYSHKLFKREEPSLRQYIQKPSLPSELHELMEISFGFKNNDETAYQSKTLGSIGIPPRIAPAAAEADVSRIPTISDLYRDGVLKGEPAIGTLGARLNTKISLIRHDITALKVDAIVNAADEDLAPSNQVLNERIHKLAGPGFTDECLSLGGCAVGDVRMTQAGSLPCKRVIHAVRPAHWQGARRNEPQELLESCYRRSLETLVESGLKTIAFPTLSAGGYGVPTRKAAQVALATVRSFLEQSDEEDVERVVFCVFTPEDEYAYHHLIPIFFPPVALDSLGNDEGLDRDQPDDLRHEITTSPWSDSEGASEEASDEEDVLSEIETDDAISPNPSTLVANTMPTSTETKPWICCQCRARPNIQPRCMICYHASCKLCIRETADTPESVLWLVPLHPINDEGSASSDVSDLALRRWIRSRPTTPVQEPIEPVVKKSDTDDVIPNLSSSIDEEIVEFSMSGMPNPDDRPAEKNITGGNRELNFGMIHRKDLTIDTLTWHGLSWRYHTEDTIVMIHRELEEDKMMKLAEHSKRLRERLPGCIIERTTESLFELQVSRPFQSPEAKDVANVIVEVLVYEDDWRISTLGDDRFSLNGKPIQDLNRINSGDVLMFQDDELHSLSIWRLECCGGLARDEKALRKEAEKRAPALYLAAEAGHAGGTSSETTGNMSEDLLYNMSIPGVQLVTPADLKPKDPLNDTIAVWTRIPRTLVNPAALQEKGLIFEERVGFILVLNELGKQEIEDLMARTKLLRAEKAERVKLKKERAKSKKDIRNTRQAKRDSKRTALE